MIIIYCTIIEKAERSTILKKTLSLILAVLTLACCIPLSISAAEELPIFVTASKNGETATINPHGNVFYLSSMVDVSKLELCSANGDISYESPDKAYSGTLAAGQTLDLTKAQSTDERGVKCYKLKLTVNGKSANYVFYSDSSLASVFVTTSKGLSYIDSSKSNRDKNAKILVMSADGKVEYSDMTSADGTSSEIKLRGNATSGYYKKPYQIKLGKKAGLLGMDKAKTWILLANYTDQSALHNALAFTMGDTLGLKYNIEYRFTNLYVDGKYLGMYMICEKVQIDSARIDISELEKDNEDANPDVDFDSLSQKKVTNSALTNGTIIDYYTYFPGIKSPEDITGAYLVELDNNYGTSEPSHFRTENGNIYVVKSPEYATREEMEYIAALFADMEEAIYSDTGYNKKGKHYSEYIDIESFAGVYTVQELMKNWDAYTSSVFFYKDADKNGEQAKIFCGPLWDLDNTLGNINYNKDFGTDTAYLWAQFGNFGGYHRGFAKNLMEHADFQQATANCFDTLYEAVQGYLAEGGWLQTMSESIRDSVMMDRTRWEMYNSDRWLLNKYESKSNVKFVWFAEYGAYNDSVQTTALGFMRYYLSSRAEALKLSIGTVGIDPPTPGGTTAPTQTTTSSKVTSSTTTKPTTGKTTSAQITTSVSTTAHKQQSPAKNNAPIVWTCIIAVSVIAVCTTILITVKKKKNKI
jgi:hypothetical protein